MQDFDSEILSGRHRADVYWSKYETVDTRNHTRRFGVPVRVMKEMVKLAANTQRSLSPDWTRKRLFAMATAFEKAGVPRKEISFKVAYSALSYRRVCELLPRKFKDISKAEAGRKGGFAAAVAATSKRGSPLSNEDPTALGGTL